MRCALLAIVALGGAARVAWVLRAAEPPSTLRDPALYLTLASNVADGLGYRYPGEEGGVTAYYPPGYPLALALAFRLAELLPHDPSDFQVAIAFGVALSTATLALVFELGRRLVGARVGLAAAALVACWPNLIFHSGVILTETSFLFLLVSWLLVVLATPEAASAPGRGRLVATGLLFGLAGLVRPTSLVAGPLFLWLWWPAGAAGAVRRTACVAAAALVVVLPWTLRNAVQMDAFVLISTNFGDNFCMGHSPEATGAFSMSPTCFDGLHGGPRPEFEIRRQAETFRRGLRYIRENPRQVLALMPAKLRVTLADDADGLAAASDYGAHEPFPAHRMRALEAVANGYYAVVMLAAIAGGVLLVRHDDRARRRTFLLAVGAIQLLPPLLTFGNARFKMPMVPMVAVCGGMALVALAGRRPRSTAGPAAPLG